MHVKKIGSRIYGATLTPSEKKAMEIEIRKQISASEREHELEVDSLILRILHDEFGFGTRRLKRFYRDYILGMSEIACRYEDPECGEYNANTVALSDIGIDIEQWYRLEEL